MGNYFPDSSKASFRHRKLLSCGESDMSATQSNSSNQPCIITKWPRAQENTVGGGTRGVNLEQIIPQHLGFTCSSSCWEVYSSRLPSRLLISSCLPTATRSPKGQRQLNRNYFSAKYFSSALLPARLLPLSVFH